jgi:hypothetical protein
VAGVEDGAESFVPVGGLGCEDRVDFVEQECRRSGVDGAVDDGLRRCDGRPGARHGQLEQLEEPGLAALSDRRRHGQVGGLLDPFDEVRVNDPERDGEPLLGRHDDVPLDQVEQPRE